MRRLLIAAALATSLAACVTGPSEKDWTGQPDSQPFATAVAACNEISRGSEANFTICMAGRGWQKKA